MERKTITIEEIEANPNLDLTERINKFSKDKRWTAQDLKELAIASIKQEYEYWANNMANVPGIDEILQQTLNGHVYTQTELVEIMTPEIAIPTEMQKYEDLQKRISDNNGITIEDFYELCQTIGFDEQTIEVLKNGFKNKGLIIDSYKVEEPRHR